MNDEWRDRLLAYDEKDLDPVERRALDRLLDADAEARELLAALRRDRERMQAAFGSVTAPAGFTDRVMERIPARRGWMPVPRLLELCATCLLGFVVWTVAAPGRRLEQARQARCQETVKDLTQAVLTYAEDYDGRLPDSQQWVVQVSTNSRRQFGVECPSDARDNPVSYSMPLGLGGADVHAVPSPWSQAVMFDAEGLFAAPRHLRGANVGYLDGRATLVSSDDPGLFWSDGRR